MFLFFSSPVQPISGNLKRIYLPVKWIPQMETFLHSLHMQKAVSASENTLHKELLNNTCPIVLCNPQLVGCDPWRRGTKRRKIAELRNQLKQNVKHFCKEFSTSSLPRNAEVRALCYLMFLPHILAGGRVNASFTLPVLKSI